MVNGFLKVFYTDKNFGFIQEDGVEQSYNSGIFCHKNDFPEEIEIFNGLRVSFDIEETERGKKAINIQILEDQ